MWIPLRAEKMAGYRDDRVAIWREPDINQEPYRALHETKDMRIQRPRF